MVPQNDYYKGGQSPPFNFGEFMNEINGIIIINKEKNYTSHDVVARVRRILSTRKVGHTGTLDPDATGVLPVCIGKGTKVSDMLTFSDKEYVAGVKLGVVTDTQDIWGTVTEEKEVKDFSRDRLMEAISHFTGEISQIPPMYSAIKINGQKMCDLAREGIEVERKARNVTIYDIQILEVGEDSFRIRVACSKGTYIRTLCHDIGQYLGCGACMTSLVRTKSSIFNIEEAITLEKLENTVSGGRLDEIIRPVDSVFMHLPRFDADDEITKRLGNGALSTVYVPCGEYRVYNSAGEFIAIGRVEQIKSRRKIGVVKNFS